MHALSLPTNYVTDYRHAALHRVGPFDTPTPQNDFLIPVDDDFYDYQRNFKLSAMTFDHDKSESPTRRRATLPAFPGWEPPCPDNITRAVSAFARFVRFARSPRPAPDHIAVSDQRLPPECVG